MKRLLLASLLAVAAIPVAAQDRSSIPPSQIAPHWGFVRKAPCGTPGDACGSNPPTWHITPHQCGTLFSTSGAHNTDGSFSNSGVRYTLPTVDELAAAGYNGAGARGTEGFTNREGQCQISFVMGAPGPVEYLRIGIDGVAGSDKVTPFAQGAYDMFHGDLVFDYRTPGVLTFVWNGTSWLALSGSPAVMERLQLGQLNAHGQGRLFKVTADPGWWTAGTRVGALAYCPTHGQGFIGTSNGGFQLTLLPGCVFRNNERAAGIDWMVLRNVPSAQVTGLFGGASYRGGTAPNGAAFPAGIYPVLTFSSLVGGYVSGDVIELHNMRTKLGTVLEGRYIGKLLTAGVDRGCAAASLCVELHEKIDEGNGAGAAVNVGAPASYVAGDDLSLKPVVGVNYTTLTTSSVASGRRTNAVTFHEIDGTATHSTIVGLAVRNAANGYEDSVTRRGVASLFNPVEKKCQTTFAADRSVTSTTFVEVGSEIRCTFGYINGVSAAAASLGDPGRSVRYSATIGANNGTASDGCEFAIAFDGTTPESEVNGFVNPAGVSGGRQSVTVAGAREGLSDTSHFITLLARAVAGGTCTVFSGSTQLTAYIWQ